MGCSNCGTGSCGTNETPGGCGNKGHCASGSCNKLNTFDWLAGISLPDHSNLDVIEVSFKQGARKEFFRKPHYLHVQHGDYVTVESPAGGYDIGQVTLCGELVRLQLKKKKVKENAILPMVLRTANERDLERLEEARALEKETMVKARVIARSLNLQMKIGDVEYQGDKRKVTLYYTADGRVDFRELIRIYAKEFKVKIEMRQIGARQESARIGGIGACGRELCCSTWLTDFKSVSTLAARYQNLAINQSKLSGQCGRLKCCLNYELNTYLDALRNFPRNTEVLRTQRGTATLVKTDIFKRLMYFSYHKDGGGNELYAIPVEHVKAIAQLNEKGIKPAELLEEGMENEARKSSGRQGSGSQAGDDQMQFVDGSGSIELPADKRKRKKKRGNKPNAPAPQGQGQAQKEGQTPPEAKEAKEPQAPREPRPPKPPREQQPKKEREEKQQQEPQTPQQKAPKGPHPQAPKGPKEPREPKDNQAPKEPRPPKDNQQGDQGQDNPPTGQKPPQQGPHKPNHRRRPPRRPPHPPQKPPSGQN
jgi:cell fate regulator YaaT (PSP1 superfamily)